MLTFKNTLRKVQGSNFIKMFAYPFYNTSYNITFYDITTPFRLAFAVSMQYLLICPALMLFYDEVKHL